MKRPGDNEPDPVGGRAAERLREFLRERLPEGMSPDEANPHIDHLTAETPKRSELETEPDNATPPDNFENNSENPGRR